MKFRTFFLTFLACGLMLQASESEQVVARHTDNNNYQSRRMHQDGKKTPPQPMRSYVTPLKADDGILFIEGEYLYWKPAAYIPYATTMDLTTFGNGSGDTQVEANNMKLHRVSLSAKSGFRVGLGFYLPPDGWTTSFYYNFLKRTSRDSAAAGSRTTAPDSDSTELNAIWRSVRLATDSATFAKITTATAKQKFSYQVFDWVWNKTFYRKHKFALSPYIGIRGAWIYNTLDVLYQGNSQISATDQSIEDDVRLRSDFRGWGLRGGLQGNWMLGWGFELFGNTSLSGLWGKHDFYHRENFISAADAANLIVRGDITNHFDWRSMKSSLQLQLGFDWGWFFSNDSMYFGLKIAYEMNYWPNLVQIRKLRRDLGDGATYAADDALASNKYTLVQYFNSDLSTQGLTIGAKFDF